MSDGQSILDNPLVMDQVKEYIKTKKILILDKSGTTRSQLVKLLQDLGATRDFIFSLRSPGEAKALILKEEISIILSEFEVDSVPSLPLFEKVMQNFSAQDRTLIMVTKNAEQSNVAQAMEEEVDSYILKPFVYNYIKEKLVKTFFSKKHPSTYQKQVFSVKQFIQDKNWNEAQGIVSSLIESKEHNPCVAYYLQARIHEGNSQLDKAKAWYLKALQVQESHFKSLNALFELFYREESYENALKMLERIKSMLPLSPKKLEQLFILYSNLNMPMKTLHLVEDYKDLDSKHRTLVFTAIESLIKVGKDFVAVNRLDLAHEAFLSAIGFSGFDFDVISQSCLFLVKNNQVKLAEYLLSKTPSDDRSSEEFMILDFKVNSLSAGENYIFTRAKDLIKANIADEVVYEKYIEINIKKEKLTLAEQSLIEAKNKFSKNLSLWHSLEKEIDKVRETQSQKEASAVQEALVLAS